MIDAPVSVRCGHRRAPSTPSDWLIMTANQPGALNASTPATRADAWTTAEDTALAAASRLDDAARTTRERLGELEGRPDMSAAAAQLDREAAAIESDAATRRGMAQGYATIRALQGGAATASAGVVAIPVAATAPAVDSSFEEEDDEDDEPPREPEVFTTCYECDDLLDEPTTDEAKSLHPECDPDTPPPFWMGRLNTAGTSIDQNDADSYRRLKSLAMDALDMILEWEVPTGDTFISFPDGSTVDARTWIERPENLELAGGREQYDGRGEFDPAAPNRCWFGGTLPSGGMARPMARSFDDVADLARSVCEDEFRGDQKSRLDEGFTVMLPGGELADAQEWARRPVTRTLAGYHSVRSDPDAPERCWLGPTLTFDPESAPIERLSVSFESVADVAADVCRRTHAANHGRLGADSAPLTVVLPGGELVNAYDWAQQPETRRLAGYTPVAVDPNLPEQCWVGPSSDGGAPVERLATACPDVTALAVHVCDAVFQHERIYRTDTHVVMLPSGELMDAYDWAQLPDTRRLAGCTTVRNRICYIATGTCRKCDTTFTAEADRTVQGEIGERTVVGVGAMYCENCDDYAMSEPITITMMDDDSVATGQPRRVLDEPS